MSPGWIDKENTGRDIGQSKRKGAPKESPKNKFNVLLQELLYNGPEVRFSNYLKIVTDPEYRFVDLQDPADIYRGPCDNNIARNGVDGLLKVLDLVIAVSHCRENILKMVILLEGTDNRSYSKWARINVSC